MNKVLGPDTVRVGSDPSLEVQYLPTGCKPVDVLLKGGVPRGRIVEFLGPFSALKSYVGMKAMARTQQNGGTVAIVDTEGSFDPEWYGILGGDPDGILVMHPPHGEKAIMVTETLLRSSADLIVWDSVAATITKNSIEKTAEDDVQPARLAAFMSRALPRLTAANTGKTSIIMINQTRLNIGVTFGSPETTPGGRALPYYASYRLKFAKAGKVTEDTKSWDGDKWVNGKSQTGTKIRMTLEKSKLNAPFRESWFTFDFKTGEIDDTGFLIAQGLENNLVTMANARWSLNRNGWNGGKSAHGQEKFRAALTDGDLQWIEDRLMGLPEPALVNPKGKALASSGAQSRRPVKSKVVGRKPAS